jgi:2-polyprenyl-3-methyl-5-hydroxy-6-metoxy-1,4-benzoquinol methylase
MENGRNEKIVESWNENANVWTSAVRTNALESRKLVTNDAIINAVLVCGASRTLDVGCGEGWLAHALIKQGKDVTGFDGSADLIEHALAPAGSGLPALAAAKFHVLSYENFCANPRAVGSDFDAVVCNFSLLGDQLNQILKAILSITKPSGHLIIQTLHPYSSVGDHYYQDGWREESFSPLPGQWSPMPWYFRTVSSWLRELTSSGWRLEELKEPLHPVTGKPASLILIGVKPG